MKNLLLDGNGCEKVSEPRLVMAFRNKQLDILYGPTDLTVEVRDYDHDLPEDDTRVLTDINGSTFRAFIFKADKEMEVKDE